MVNQLFYLLNKKSDFTGTALFLLQYIWIKKQLLFKSSIKLHIIISLSTNNENRIPEEKKKGYRSGEGKREPVPQKVAEQGEQGHGHGEEHADDHPGKRAVPGTHHLQG